ncbi:hypothetical protein [Chryseobacterium contaminans]|uniref:Uncharacterized protein n=2 Tax=Chryseobacterium contaminans TaxID=1423959 RepID=A0A1M6Z8M5_9FLAO|nr:hypothetical protein [Chryseobacterium contaminans]SHL26816.1 hypothetical protein SAMN05444407_103131 [Chryseobacterium contaminans]
MRTNLSMLVLALCSCSMYSQVGINTAAPESTLDVRAKNHLGTVTAQDGVLVPRVNSLSASGSVNGQLVYLIADAGGFIKGFHFWNGTVWQPLGGSGGSGDPTKDAWVDNIPNTLVELGSKSDGTSRTAGTEFVALDNGAVGIGTPAPDGSAMLDVTANDKGFLPPRVVLTNRTMQLNASTANATGLWVYNTGGTGNLPHGYYYWNGSEWRQVTSITTDPPSISTLNCDAAGLRPSSYTAGVPYSGMIRVPYSGGNGRPYTAGSSVTVNGLTLTLLEGILEQGTGYLYFKVEGTPTVSSPTTTTFPINSSVVPFWTGTCNITVGNSLATDLDSFAILGPLKATSDNGRAGYATTITTRDGKYSVRCFVPDGSAFAAVNLQIRNNSTSTVDIISNGHYLWSGAGGYMQNQLRLPANTWAGDNATSNSALIVATGQTATNFPSWGDGGVYASGMPEQRLYKWTAYDTNEKTFYSLEFMMGSNNPNGVANATTCPGGVCAGTKVFFKIDQITAQ